MQNRDAERPLDNADRRLEAVLNNATVSIFLMDDRQHCVYMNRAAELLTGFTIGEVLSLDKPLHDIIHHTYPDGTPFPLHECAIDRAFPDRHHVQGEEMFVREDGTLYPVAFTASPITDETSRTVGTIIEVRDIREERQARERQQLLLNELNHRVKNTLTIVQSIAMHSLREQPVRNLEDFSGRLLALSRAHDILQGTAWQGASLRDVVRAAIAGFGEDRFQLDGPDTPVDPKMSVTFSMVLHELGTNALKYGALSERAGKVRLRWRCTQEQDCRLIDMEWVELGGPLVKKPHRVGFGMRLIERQVAREFNGTATLDFRPEGLVCTIRARLPRAPEVRLG